MKFSAGALAATAFLLCSGCLNFFGPTVLESDRRDRILIWAWWKGLSGVDTTTYVPFGAGNSSQEGPLQPISPEIQSLQTSTVSLRTGVAGGPQAGLHPQAQSQSSTSVYILDVISLFQMDPVTAQVLRSLDLTAGQPGSPDRFAVTSDNKFAVVTNINRPNPSYVLIVDLASFTVVAKISIPENANAYGVAITPDNQFAYVVTQSLATGQNSVYVLDLNARQIVTTIPLPNYQSLENIVMASDGIQAYLNSGVGGDLKIPVIDIQTNGLAAEIPTIYYSSSGKASLLTGPAYMAVHPDGTRVYLAPMDGGPIFVIDTASNAITHMIAIPQGAASPSGTSPVFTADGRYLTILDGAAAFSVIDTQDDTLYQTLPLDPLVANGAAGGTRVGFAYVPGQ